MNSQEEITNTVTIKTAVVLDRLFCMIFGWNTAYHTENFFLKLRPTLVFYVLQKR